MDKVDVLMVVLGVAAYMATMMDLRNYERKMAAFEAVQERRRKYAELQAERRKAELAMEKSVKNSTQNKDKEKNKAEPNILDTVSKL